MAGSASVLRGALKARIARVARARSALANSQRASREQALHADLRAHFDRALGEITSVVGRGEQQGQADQACTRAEVDVTSSDRRGDSRCSG